MVQISGWVFTLLHFSIGSVWFSRGKIASKQECIITTCLLTFLSDSAKHRQCYLQFSADESSDLEKLSTQKYDDIFTCGGHWIAWISRTVVICSLREKINLVENKNHPNAEWRTASDSWMEYKQVQLTVNMLNQWQPAIYKCPFPVWI